MTLQVLCKIFCKELADFFLKFRNSLQVSMRKMNTIHARKSHELFDAED